MDLRMLLVAAALLLVPTALAATQEHELYLHDVGRLHLLPEQINAKVGDTLKFMVENQGTTPHDLVVCGDAGAPRPQSTCSERWAFIPTLQPNGTAPLTFTVDKAGTFEYYCTIPGHKSGGMTALLIVSGEKKSVPVPPMFAALAILGALSLLGRRHA